MNSSLPNRDSRIRVPPGGDSRALVPRARVLLVLGRVSNLPTVWSNCLAGWVLAGGGLRSELLLLCFGATLLYLGGMFLNDAFDVDFDRKHRPERPIVSGQIDARSVWGLGLLGLLLGWVALAVLGTGAAVAGLALVIAIVVYDAVHKRTMVAPVIMASCRFLLYLVAAAAAGGISADICGRALALAAYVTGLSFVARTETVGRGVPTAPPSLTSAVTARWGHRALPVWPQPLLFVPVIVAVLVGQLDNAMTWVSIGACGAWVVWCLQPVSDCQPRVLPSGVSGLLAGIPLVDWVAQGSAASGLWPVFLFFFVSALLLQRGVPAT